MSLNDKSQMKNDKEAQCALGNKPLAIKFARGFYHLSFIICHLAKRLFMVSLHEWTCHNSA